MGPPVAVARADGPGQRVAANRKLPFTRFAMPGSAVPATTTATPTSARQARTEEIVDAAVRLFGERGFTETGIDDIGAAVGITGPAVYRYFASKEDVLVAVVDRAVEHASGLTDVARAGSSSPEETLERLIDGAVRVCIADRALT